MVNYQGNIGRTSKETGVHIETIRYYERIGLIPKPERSSGGQRIYGPADRQRLIFIHRCRDLGFSLDDIRALLDLAETDTRTCQDVKEKTDAHLKTVRKKIADLKRMEASLKELSRSCEGGTSPDCPIIERLFS